MSRYRTLAFALWLATIGIGCQSTSGARALEREGLELMKKGNLVEASAKLSEALVDDDRLYQAAIALAHCHNLRGNPGGALEVLEGYARRHPHLGLVLVTLGDLYARLELLPQALQAYQQAGSALAYEPAYLRMARVYVRMGNPRMAEQALLQALELQPNNLDAHYELAQLYDHLELTQAGSAWESYVEEAGGVRAEHLRFEHALGRVRALYSRPTEQVATAGLRLARALLLPISEHTPPTEVVNAIKAESLQRYWQRRVWISVYSTQSYAPPLRGTGIGKTLADAISQAINDCKQSQLFALHYASSLATCQIVLSVPTTNPKPFAPRSQLGDNEALIVEAADVAARTVLDLDRARLGLATTEQVVANATRHVAQRASDTNAVHLSHVAILSYAEPVHGPSLVRIENAAFGPTQTIEQGIREACNFLLRHLRPDGTLANQHGSQAASSTQTLDPHSHAQACFLLATAASTLDERRYGDAAHMLYASLPAEVAELDQLRCTAALKKPQPELRTPATPTDLSYLAACLDTPLCASETWLVGAKSAVGEAMGSGTTAPTAQLVAIAAELWAKTPLEREELKAAAAWCDRIGALLEDPNGCGNERLELVVAAAKLPKQLQPTSLEKALNRELVAVLGLQLTADRLALLQVSTKARGAFRPQRFDTTLPTSDTIRKALALLTQLPQSANRSVTKKPR